MSRYLVLANQTAGGQQLKDAIRERISKSSEKPHFHVVVPMTATKDETTQWTSSTGVEGVSLSPLSLSDRAGKRAEQRLSLLIDRIEDEGGYADGHVGPPDPVEAAEAALADNDYDEVILSTLPARLSRWLRMDVPSRLTRSTDIPVTTIEAED